MSLLAPAFLAGLALLAVPILVHLTQRQRGEVHGFPSLMFLRRVPFRTSSRRRIRHPLLFALRCAAVALVALAFARPALPGGAEAAEEAAARDRVILLDVSGSVGHGGRWDRALVAVGEALDGLGDGDRAALVTFDDRAAERVALTTGLDGVRRALDAARPGHRATRFDPAIQLAGRILAESDRRTRDVFLVSDFQRSGWEEGGRARLPDGVSLVPVDLSDPEAENRAVVEVSFHARRDGRLDVAARIANLGDEPVPELPVSLELGGRVVATRSAELSPRAAATVTFERIAVPEGRTRGEVRIAEDALPLDDVRRFLVEPGDGVDVLVLESSGGREDASLFLERALAIGEAPPIRTSRRRSAGLERSWLAGTDVVVLNDAGLPDVGRVGLLREWVARGGGLLAALGPRSAPAAGPAGAAELLGGRAGGVEDRAGRGGSRIAWLDYDHPALELFAAPRSGDFSRARFFRFHRFEPAEGTAVLARFEDGDPALLERTEGAGRVLVWTSTLDRFWNDLALQPVYLPFVHRLVRHVAGWREPRRWWTVGQVVELGTVLEGAGLAGSEAEPADGEWVLVSPDGGRRTVGGTTGSTWLDLDRAGYWELRPAGETAAAATLAVNAPLEESDLTAVAPERVTAAATGVVDGGPAAAGREAAGAAPPRSAADGSGGGEETGRELWWPLLLAAGLILAVESVLANRWARRRPFRPASRAA